MKDNDVLTGSTRRLAKLNRARLLGLAQALLAVATHADRPVWVRVEAINLFNEACFDQQAEDRIKGRGARWEDL